MFHSATCNILALTLLDKYDHPSREKPEGNRPIYRITYADGRAMVDRMEDSFKSDVSGLRKSRIRWEGYWLLYIRMYLEQETIINFNAPNGCPDKYLSLKPSMFTNSLSIIEYMYIILINRN